MSSSDAAAATAHSFNKILNQPRLSSKSRASADVDDGTKKLRRLILVEGIPSQVVCIGGIQHIIYQFHTS
jgi:cell cycle arrest protein BUB2